MVNNRKIISNSGRVTYSYSVPFEFKLKGKIMGPNLAQIWIYDHFGEIPVQGHFLIETKASTETSRGTFTMTIDSF